MADPLLAQIAGARPGGPLQPALGPEAERARVAELAREFEAVLLAQMLRQMRQSLLDPEPEGERSGFGSSTLFDTIDVELARELSRKGGIGLAGMVERGMNATLNGGPRSGSASGGDDGGGGPAAGVGRPTTARPFDRTGPAADRGAPAPGASSEAAVSLALPLETPLSSSFGWRADPFHGRTRFHAGVDFRAAYGREVPTAAPGRVVFAGEHGGYGNSVVVEHDGGVQTRYAHLSTIDVSTGQELASGDVVGRVGQSGRATGPHLHFEVLLDGRRVDPTLVAQRVPGGLKPPLIGVDSSFDRVSMRAPANGVTHED